MASHRLAPLWLRLTAGSILCYHGYQKLFGGGDAMTHFTDMVRSFDLPFVGEHAPILAQVAAWGEFAGGALLIIGFATRIAAIVNFWTMFVAIWKVHLAGVDLIEGIKTRIDGPNSYALPLVILGCCMSLFLSGAGALSVDAYLAPRRSLPADRV